MSNTPYTSRHIAHLSDTGDYRAVLKIRSGYAANLGRYGLRDTMVDVVDTATTLDIGITASELVNNSVRPDILLLALNCAPADNAKGTVDNARKNFFFADLGDNVFAGGTCNGLELSYLKDRVQSLYELKTTNAGKSQFRSLEVLPEHIIAFSIPEQRQRLIDLGALQEVKDIDQIIRPVPDVSHVIEIDSFKNVKFLPSQADRRLLDQISEAKFGFGLTIVPLHDLTNKQFGQPSEVLIPASVEFDSGKKTKISRYFEAEVHPTFFAAATGTNIIARKSSSKIFGGQSVPMIATIRDAETLAQTSPAYEIPSLGQPIGLELKPAA